MEVAVLCVSIHATILAANKVLVQLGEEIA